jgi:hypothetical protein
MYQEKSGNPAWRRETQLAARNLIPHLLSRLITPFGSKTGLRNKMSKIKRSTFVSNISNFL